MEKRYNTNLERHWIFYVICLFAGILHIILNQEPPMWLSLIDVAVACVVEVLIKSFFRKKYGVIGAMKYGIYS
jgi:hypothetical protein